MKWAWRAPTGDIAFHLNYLTSAKRLEIDGKQVDVPRSALSTKWRHTFPVKDRTATLVFALRYFLIPEASLDIDGAVLDPVDAPPKLPAWVWLFALANVAVLYVTKGGAIPGMLAGVGLASCVGVNFSRLSVAVRLLLCTLITAGVWGAVYAMVNAAT
jgi:hypothetical protein